MFGLRPGTWNSYWPLAPGGVILSTAIEDRVQSGPRAVFASMAAVDDVMQQSRELG